MSRGDLELLRLHVEAVWGLRLPGLVPGDAELPDRAGSPPWRLYLAQLGGSEVRLWCGVAPPARPALVERARAALAGLPGGADLRAEVVFRRDAPPPPSPAGLARRLGASDRDLLEAFEPGETAYWLEPRRGPLFGAVEGGRLLSVAHSSRRTARACEAGVHTLPEARRRGWARACLCAWAEAVAAEGLEPLYSADAANVASHALARSCGYRPFARAAYAAEGLAAARGA